MRYNILGLNQYVTIRDAAEGVPQYLFKIGVRIEQHDLSLRDALNITTNMVGRMFYNDYTNFVKQVAGDPPEREPGRAWKKVGSKWSISRYDNPKDQRYIDGLEPAPRTTFGKY